MENRFFVLKGIKLGSGDLKAGDYLSEDDVKSTGERSLSRLVRLAIILDVTGEINLPRLDGDKRRKRHRYLSAIGTDESRRVLEILESQDNKVRIVYNERASQRSAERKRTAKGLSPLEEEVIEKVAEEVAETESEPEESFTPLTPDDVLSDSKPKQKGKKGHKRGR